MLRRAAQFPVLNPAIVAYYENKSFGHSWNKEHPYDRAHGVRTSGKLPGFLLRPGKPVDDLASDYLAAQPSSFGKRWPQYRIRNFAISWTSDAARGGPFLSRGNFASPPSLNSLRRSPASPVPMRNVFLRVHPDRIPIAVVTGDALEYELPGQKTRDLPLQPVPSRPDRATPPSHRIIVAGDQPRSLHHLLHPDLGRCVRNRSRTTLRRRNP